MEELDHDRGRALAHADDGDGGRLDEGDAQVGQLLAQSEGSQVASGAAADDADRLVLARWCGHGAIVPRTGWGGALGANDPRLEHHHFHTIQTAKRRFNTRTHIVPRQAAQIAAKSGNRHRLYPPRPDLPDKIL